jgi:hypothetical protein
MIAMSVIIKIRLLGQRHLDWRPGDGDKITIYLHSTEVIGVIPTESPCFRRVVENHLITGGSEVPEVSSYIYWRPVSNFNIIHDLRLTRTHTENDSTKNQE